MRSFRLTRRSWLRLTTGAVGGLALAWHRAPGASAADAAALSSPTRVRSTVGPAARSALAQGDSVLHSAEPFGPPTLEPTNNISSYLIRFGLGETLLKVTPDGSFVPWLAESVAPLDPLRWQVKLRSGVTFWNGRGVDAEAVRGSIMRAVAKNPSSAALLNLASAEAADPQTVILTTRSPNGGMLSHLAGFRAIVHDAEHAAQVGDEAFGLAPMLTGPFIPTEFRVRELVTAKRFDGYWQGPAKLAGIEMRAVADANARLAAMLAGDVEMARDLPVAATAQARAAGVTVISSPTNFMYQVYLNNRREPFTDAATRQALSLAIDRESLIAHVLGGVGSIATGPFASFHPFAAPTPLAYDPARAKQLLDSAGWVDQGGGARMRGGQALEFELLTYPARPDLVLLATAIQAQLAEVGVTVTLRSVESASITGILDKGEYQASMWTLQMAPSGDPGYILQTVYTTGGDSNPQLGYTSPRFDALIAQLNGTTDVAQRFALAQQAQAILREDSPAIYLMSPSFNTLHSSRLQSFVASPFDHYLIDSSLALA
jgi:peptide/nickel transport system substrate-binding protein